MNSLVGGIDNVPRKLAVVVREDPNESGEDVEGGQSPESGNIGWQLSTARPSIGILSEDPA